MISSLPTPETLPSGQTRAHTRNALKMTRNNAVQPISAALRGNQDSIRDLLPSYKTSFPVLSSNGPTRPPISPDEQLLPTPSPAPPVVWKHAVNAPPHPQFLSRRCPFLLDFSRSSCLRRDLPFSSGSLTKKREDWLQKKKKQWKNYPRFPKKMGK